MGICNVWLGRTRERNQAEKRYREMQEVIGDRLGQVEIGCQ